ncbi:zinc-binding oxidoreductase alcohol dehydrogenase [Scheffersomyces xylosifermentans]|uniref:zinc-binding oxidoreductase alcohol dehydrogenase n=1 Tax=Scheffersomyces xylosifermentans TaxID=1304137 RepID=UPI00315D0D80
MPSNRAAIFSGSKDLGKIAKIEEVDFPVANDDQLIIKSVAFAANPTDWKHAVLEWGTPGSFVGTDVSCVVHSVGKNVKGFAVGDIVATFLHSGPDRGAFSEYVTADPPLTIKFDKESFDVSPLPVGSSPSSVIKNFEGAASSALSLGTIAVSFADSLKISENKEENSERYILIWGGATATGIYAIQIAKLVYGLKVITTASPKNHEFLKSLGADVIFDYRQPSVIEDIVKFANGKIAYALDGVSTKKTYQQVYDATKGSEKVGFDNLLFLPSSVLTVDPERKSDTFAATLVYLAEARTQIVSGSKIEPSQELVDNYNHFWNDLLPPHIQELKTPALRILSSGLESTNEALDLLRVDKVSGEKVVFRA